MTICGWTGDPVRDRSGLAVHGAGKRKLFGLEYYPRIAVPAQGKQSSHVAQDCIASVEEMYVFQHWHAVRDRYGLAGGESLSHAYPSWTAARSTSASSSGKRSSTSNQGHVRAVQAPSQVNVSQTASEQSDEIMEIVCRREATAAAAWPCNPGFAATVRATMHQYRPSKPSNQAWLSFSIGIC